MFSTNYLFQLRSNTSLTIYKKHILLLSSFILLGVSATYGQEKFYDLKGVVLSAKDSTALPFVHIALKDARRVLISNENGLFLLNINERYLKDSIVFSTLGFTPDTLYVQDAIKNDSLVMYLEKSSTFLPEILVTSRADSALMILKKAFRRIKQNYPVKPYQIEGFYREANIENDNYARLVETAVSIDDKGYKKPLDKMQFKLNQLRKSDDLRQLNWYDAVGEWTREINGLVNFMYNDLLRVKTPLKFSNLYELGPSLGTNLELWRSKKINLSKYLHNKNIDLVEYTTFQNEPVWVIEIVSEQRTRGFFKNYISEGKIYVQQKNFAILGYDFKLKAKPQQKQKKQLLAKPIQDKKYEALRRYTIDGETLLSRSVRYKRYKGRYYLSYIDTKMTGTSSRFANSNKVRRKKEFQERKTAKFYEHKQLMVSKISINKKSFIKIKKSERIDKELALHNTKFPYNPSFWSNYNIIKRNPLGREVAEELSLTKELEQQFNANEKPHIQASRLSATNQNYISYTDKVNKSDYLEELNDSTFLLNGISIDDTYGFTPENPILLGTRNVYSNSFEYPYKYLNALLGSKKQRVLYRLKGYTNPFKTPNSRATFDKNSEFAFGLLVRCEIWEEGSSNKKPIFLNLNDEGEEVLAPKGFKYKKK